MLESVSITNFALIESVSLDFDVGFTVLSGETGAGKSILIGALSFLLGGKGGVEVIRAGATEARVSGTFLLSKTRHDETFAWLEEHGIETDDGRVLLRRFVKDTGRGGAWIQNTPVTRGELSEFSAFLVDIHGQHEHQSLMKVPEHRRYLDSYGGLTEEVEAFTKKYSILVEKRRQLSEMNISNAERQNKIELLQFALSEIEEAKLKENEDEDLTLEENRLSQFEQIFSDTEVITSILWGSHNEESGSVISSLKKIRGYMESLSKMDSSLDNLSSRVENVFYELSDIGEEVKTYSNSLIFDPSRLEEVQDRLALIFKLKKKYASSVQAPLREIFEYQSKASKELELLTGSEESQALLQGEIKKLEGELYQAAKSLSEKRHAVAKKMSQEVMAVLQNLGMKGARFKVSITSKPEDVGGVMQLCGPYGMDNIEFLIGANAGSEEKPLAKIASGGEISRVMLALKTILADSSKVDTLIFDEIDTGIGGEISVVVGAHLKKLSKNNQILCITHVASIAVYADNQVKIEKSSDLNSTVTNVSLITGQQRVEEIARMLSGDSVSEVSLNYAQSLLEKFGSKE